jgi:hypothetical protein
MADPQGTPEFPYRFAEGMPASFREAVLRWWPSTRPGSRVKDWDWLRLNTASPDDVIWGDGEDAYPPNFDDWYEVLGGICASEDVAEAAARFEAAHAPGEDLWRELLLRSLELPPGFMHLDRRTNREKARVLRPLCARIEQVVEMIEKDLRPAAQKFRHNASAMRLSDKRKDGTPKVRAEHIDSPQVPNELRHDHERRKLISEYRLHDARLLRDIWTDPVGLNLRRAASWREVDEEGAEPVRLSACVSVFTFEEVARALASRLRAELQELRKPDRIQLSKGNAWHRYAVMRLEEVFSAFYGPVRLQELSPRPNRMIAALVNAAVPEAVISAVTPNQVSAIRKGFAARPAIRQKPPVGPVSRE